MSATDKRLVWALEYLAMHGRVSAVSYFDDGCAFLTAYKKEFFTFHTSSKTVQRSLYRLLMRASHRGLVSVRDGRNYGGYGGGDLPPSHCNDYQITSRGTRYIYPLDFMKEKA